MGDQVQRFSVGQLVPPDRRCQPAVRALVHATTRCNGADPAASTDPCNAHDEEGAYESPRVDGSSTAAGRASGLTRVFALVCRLITNEQNAVAGMVRGGRNRTADRRIAGHGLTLSQVTDSTNETSTISLRICTLDGGAAPSERSRVCRIGWIAPCVGAASSGIDQRIRVYR